MADAEVRERLTAVCLGLPAAVVEDRHSPHRGFRVGAKHFAFYVENEHGDGRIGLAVRAEPGQNGALVASDPERFALPKYTARHGWVNYFLDLDRRPPDWEEVAELVTDSYLIQAPKRLARLVGLAAD